MSKNICFVLLAEDSQAERRRSQSQIRTMWSTSSLWLRDICTRGSSGEHHTWDQEKKMWFCVKEILKSNILTSSVYEDFIDLIYHYCYFYLLFFPLRIMMLSVLKNTKTPVKFWFLKNYLSPTFKVGFFFFFLTLLLLENQPASHHWCEDFPWQLQLFSLSIVWCGLQTVVLKIEAKQAARMRFLVSL